MSSLPPLEISSGSGVTQQPPTFTGTSILKPKPESRAIKNIAQEIVTEKGAVRKENTSSIKKSSSFRSENKSQSSSPIPTESCSSSTQTKSSTTSGQDVNIQATKSPKVSRHESMERTVQRITKAIRGTSRSESRSKKNRETSVSPSKCGTSKVGLSSSSATTTAASGPIASSSNKSTKKETGKKNAHEKREIFKSLH